MKITLPKNELNQAIQQVSKAVNSKATVPILTGVKLDVTATRVTLTASDMDTSIQATIPVTDDIKIERSGSVVLPAKFFVEIIKKLPKDTVDIEVDEGFKTRIKSGRTKLDMVGLDPEEYPALPRIDEDQVLSLPGNLLRKAIKSTSFAVSTNESSPVLMGVLFNLHDGVLKLLSTDRHRLATIQLDVEDAEGVEITNIPIVGKTLNELYKLIPDSHELIDIIVANQQVLFKIDNILFYSHILDGTFPDTSKIIPSTFKTEVTINTQSLIESLDRAYLLSKEGTSNIAKFDISSEVIEVSSNGESGKVSEELEVVEKIGEDLRASFNALYMLQALKEIGSSQVHIGFTGPMSPIIIKPVQGDKSLYLVLPYRTAN
jgi:DNA polymerase-3 subunit beta